MMMIFLTFDFIVFDSNQIKKRISDERIEMDQELYSTMEHASAKTMKNMLTRMDSSEHSRALGLACAYGNSEALRVLLEDARVHPPTDDTLIMSTLGDISRQSAVILQLLLKDGRADPSFHHQRSVKEASSIRFHPELLSLLLQDPRVDPSVGNQYPLFLACLHNCTENVEILLQDPRVDPSVKDQIALETACREGHDYIVKLLLNDPRVDPSVSNNLPVRLALMKGHSGLYTLLLKDPRVNPNMTPLKARILESMFLGKIIDLKDKYRDDLPQFLISLDHLLDKEATRQTAKAYGRLKTIQNRPNIPYNIVHTVKHALVGKPNNAKPITKETMKTLQGNFFGPKDSVRKHRTRNARQRKANENSG